MTAKLRRTFHPVGQGAFYTEEVLVNDRCRFAIVYDCGATEGCNDKSSPTLKDTVKIFTSEVDYIVLSHLHDDHINGVQHLKVKANKGTKILLPQLTHDGEICVTVHNCLSAYASGTPEYYRTYAEVEAHLSNYGQLRHLPSNGNPNVVQVANGQEKRRITPILSLEERETELIWSLRDSSDKEFKWKYKFFNAHSAHEAEIVQQLKNIHDIMTDGAIDERKIVDAFKNNNTDVIGQIKKAYGSPAQRNQSSMMMFSGPFYPDTFKDSIVREDPYPLLCHRSIFPADNYCKLSGCLYCGDLNLISVKNLRTDYYKGEWDYIEIIQVPHHGAIRDFDEDLTSPPKVFFVSYGTKNHYGHPSQKVTTAIVNSGCLLFHVNEKPTTKVTYNITI